MVGTDKEEDSKENKETVADDKDVEVDDENQKMSKAILLVSATLNNAFWLAVKDGVVEALRKKE